MIGVKVKILQILKKWQIPTKFTIANRLQYEVDAHILTVCENRITLQFVDDSP